MNNKLRYLSLAIFIALNITTLFSKDAGTQTDKPETFEIATQTDEFHPLEADKQSSTAPKKKKKKSTPWISDTSKDFLYNHLPFTITSLSGEDKKSLQKTGYVLKKLSQIGKLSGDKLTSEIDTVKEKKRQAISNKVNKDHRWYSCTFGGLTLGGALFTLNSYLTKPCNYKVKQPPATAGVINDVSRRSPEEITKQTRDNAMITVAFIATGLAVELWRKSQFNKHSNNHEKYVSQLSTLCNLKKEQDKKDKEEGE